MSQLCPKCNAMHGRRVKQQGFLQKAILRRLGYYPWECRLCRTTFLLQDRGTGRSGSHVAGPDPGQVLTAD